MHTHTHTYAPHTHTQTNKQKQHRRTCTPDELISVRIPSAVKQPACNRCNGRSANSFAAFFTLACDSRTTNSDNCKINSRSKSDPEYQGPPVNDTSGTISNSMYLKTEFSREEGGRGVSTIPKLTSNSTHWSKTK